MHEDLGSAPARILTRLTILALPEVSAEAVVDDLVTVLTFENGNGPPVVLDNGCWGALVWRGYVTGGLATLYEQVARLADEHGFSALIADERLEVHLAAGRAKVSVIGPLADTIEIDRRLWEYRLERALDPDELAQWFVFDRIRESAEEILTASADQSAPPAWPGTPRLDDDRPHGIDYEQIAGSTFHLLESYEPDGELQDAVVECRRIGGRLRTDLQAPYVAHEQVPARIVGWHVAQWELTAVPDEWSLTARADAELAVVLACLPTPLRTWALERTAAALDLIDRISPDAVEDVPRERLRRELDDARLR